MKVLARKKGVQEFLPYYEGMDIEGVSISESDKNNGSPKVGDMIATNPKDIKDRWLVAKAWFDDNYEIVKKE